LQNKSQRVTSVATSIFYTACKVPRRGDLIEIFRGSYRHWAVYVGDGSVVHLVVPSKSRTHLGVVREENLRAVVGNDQWQINNSLDSTHNPRPADVIVTEARSWVGREITYHSIRSNCEHFATERRYGVSKIQNLFAKNKICAAGSSFLPV
uniref:LRAT domain-containing protein n=1 Tax=Astatotilapia calliptera TaxID=8154 RepID=A0A3P8NSC0_ASTCA